MARSNKAKTTPAVTDDPDRITVYRQGEQLSLL
jgi:hypothetical protein